MLYQTIQLCGSLLILGAFAASLLGHVDQTGYRYLIPNAAGSTVLAVTAVVGLEWGFVLLEGVWALVSSYCLVRKATGRPVATH